MDHYECNLDSENDGPEIHYQGPRTFKPRKRRGSERNLEAIQEWLGWFLFDIEEDREEDDVFLYSSEDLFEIYQDFAYLLEHIELLFDRIDALKKSRR